MRSEVCEVLVVILKITRYLPVDLFVPLFLVWSERKIERRKRKYWNEKKFLKMPNIWIHNNKRHEKKVHKLRQLLLVTEAQLPALHDYFILQERTNHNDQTLSYNPPLFFLFFLFLNSQLPVLPPFSALVQLIQIVAAALLWWVEFKLSCYSRMTLIVVNLWICEFYR